MFSPGLLNGGRILVTGGGTGLGAAMAKRFAELGAVAVICGRRDDKLQETAEAIIAAGGSCETHVCDIRDPAAVDVLMDTVWTGGALTGLVNNAGAIFVARTETLSHRAVDAVLSPNLHGSIYCTLAAGKRWIAGGDPGVVLSILSTSTITGRAYTVPTSIAKSGVLAMTRGLAVEWASKQIRLVAIAPGTVATEGMMARVRAGRDEGMMVSTNNLERYGDPAELADLASYLMSDRAAFINGEMVVMDGGRHLRNSGVEDLLARSEDDWAAADATRVKR